MRCTLIIFENKLPISANYKFLYRKQTILTSSIILQKPVKHTLAYYTLVHFITLYCPQIHCIFVCVLVYHTLLYHGYYTLFDRILQTTLQFLLILHLFLVCYNLLHISYYTLLFLGYYPLFYRCFQRTVKFIINTITFRFHGLQNCFQNT